MDEVKRQTILIIDANYIDHQLDKEKLSDQEIEKQTELPKLFQRYATRDADVLQRNEDRRKNKNEEKCRTR
eukprot:3383789-Amphidinium_carterae.1